MAAYRFGELSAFAVADISRRGADQPCDVVFFAVFAHVDTDESLVLVEEPFGELFRQQGFAHARRSDEHEDADRTPFVLESRPGALDRPRNLFDGFALADDAGRKIVRKAAQTFAFAAREPFGWDSRHGGNNLLDMLGPDFGRAGIGRKSPYGATDSRRVRCRRFAGAVFGRFGSCCGADRFAGCGFSGRFFGFAFVLQVNTCPGFVQHVDRLVRKVAVGNVAPGQGDAGPQCFVRVAHSVVPFVMGCDVVQDLQGFLFRSGFDEDFLKAAFQRGIALDIFAIFVQRRGSDDLQFAPRQGGFENVGRVEASLGRTCARDGVYFVDEEDRVLLPAQFFEKSLHPFFELTSVFGPGQERRYVERIEP